MKDKRYTTEDKIRILRDADRGKNIWEVCRQHNITTRRFNSRAWGLELSVIGLRLSKVGGGDAARVYPGPGQRAFDGV